MMIVIQLLPVLFSVCCIIAAFWQRRTKRNGIRHPVYTEAIVVSKVTQTGYRHHSTVEQSAPVVRYMAENGEVTAAYRDYVPEWQYSYRMGERIKICYEKQNPVVFQICRNQSHAWRSNLLLILAFGTLLAYAVLWLQYH